METPNSMEVFFENNPATVILPPDPEGWIISPSIRPCQVLLNLHYVNNNYCRCIINVFVM